MTLEEQLTRRIQVVRRAIARLIDAYQDGLLERGEFEPRLREARGRLAQLEAQHREQAEVAAQEHELRLALQGLEAFALQVESGLSRAGWATRREVIRAVVKRIEVGAQEIRMVYRVSPIPFDRGPGGGPLLHCWKALEAAPSDVAAGAVAFEVTPGVGGQKPLHPAAEVAVVDQPGDEVEIVRHQSVAEEPDRHAAAGLGQGVEEGVVVGGLVEDLGAGVAAVQDVVAIAPGSG